MPKQKTRKSVSKRFKVTGSGKLKRNKAGHSHMLIRRDKDVKRYAKKATMVAPSFEKRMKKMMAKAGS
jgi:large subunit ribosomal protein L35